MPASTIIRSQNTVKTNRYVFPKSPYYLKSAKNNTVSTGDKATVKLKITNPTANTITIRGGTLTVTSIGGSAVSSPTPVQTLTISTQNTEYVCTQTVGSYPYAIMEWTTNNLLVSGGLASSGAVFDYTLDTFPHYNNISALFSGASNFNQDVSFWDVSAIAYFEQTFLNASSFNQDISKWDVSSAISMDSMLRGTLAFNQNISGWNTSKCTIMSNMLNGAAAFNQNISGWDIRAVTAMGAMLAYATSFNQDISAWAAKFNIEVFLEGFISYSGMSAANYDKFLNALWLDYNTTRKTQWAARQRSKVLGAAGIYYTAASSVAREGLISSGWTITDAGLAA